MSDKYTPQDSVPIPPPDAKVHTTACDYCVVACGYKVYTWPTGSENGGIAAEENAFGRQMGGAYSPWVSPNQHNIVSVDGEDHHAVVVADFDSAVVNKTGNHSIRGGTLALKCYNPETPTRDRLQSPQIRVNGELEDVDWDTATDVMAEVSKHVLAKYGEAAWAMKTYSYEFFENTFAITKLAFNAIKTPAYSPHDKPGAGNDTAGVDDSGIITFSAGYKDWAESDVMFISGTDPFETKTIVFTSWMMGGPKMIMVLPRRTAGVAYAEENGGLFLQINIGTDTLLHLALIRYILEQGWEDKEFIRQRVYGMEDVKKEVAKWTPDEVERVAGVGEAEVRAAAKAMADNRPGTFIWCMGGTQHTIGNNNTRAYCTFQLALGNMGVSGGGTNIFRGHDNVQGATDFCILSHSLPGYYGLSGGAWKHWAGVWGLDVEWLKGQFDPASYEQSKGKDVTAMHTKGIPVSRWIDGVLEDKENIAQKDNIRTMIFWGHAPNSQTRGKEMKDAMEKLDTLVIIDPYPTASAVMHDRTDGVYLLPACTQFETYGSVTASNRSLQWRDKVIEPLFESLPDHTIMYKLANKLGLAEQLCKNIEVKDDEPVIEDITREFNSGMWTIGYSGQSPERMKKQQQNWGNFDYTSLKAEGGPCDGEYYGLPWPCWGTPEMGHPGTPNLYDGSKSVADGGLTFRARFGVERDGVNLLAEGFHSKGSAIKDGYPEFSDKMLKKLGWWDDLTSDEKAAAEGKNWKTDMSGGIQRVAIKHGCAPFGNAKARTVVWTFPDPVPIHREPLYTSRRDLVEKYPTYEDRKSFYRLPTRYGSIQAKDYSKDYPIILTSGRLVEYEGGGDETRSNPWLAELQQDMFVEMNPRDANNNGVKDGDDVWLEGAEGAKLKVKAMVTRRVAAGVAFMPFHFAGHFEGKDLRSKYPEGSDPIVLGEACNTAMTYGYDSVTQMQETKASLCRITKA